AHQDGHEDEDHGWDRANEHWRVVFSDSVLNSKPDGQPMPKRRREAQSVLQRDRTLSADRRAERVGTSLAWMRVTRTMHHHRLLLVDDDADSREAVAELLSLDGYDVGEAADGQEALDVLRRGPAPCMVLLDLHMPTASGAFFRSAQLRDRELAG